jgi:homoserine/homoserine lactone efflux protein
LIVSSYTAFLIVKFCGSAYLFYLGLKIWRSGIKPIDAQALAFPAKTSNLYLQGIVLALSNPKAIIFTTALFPQFVKIDQSVPLQFIIFALTLCSLSFTCLLGCAFISRKSFTTVRSSSIGNALSKVFGSAFMGAGIWLLATVKVART